MRKQQTEDLFTVLEGAFPGYKWLAYDLGHSYRIWCVRGGYQVSDIVSKEMLNFYSGGLAEFIKMVGQRMVNLMS